MPSARPSATATIVTSSTSEPRALCLPVRATVGLGGPRPWLGLGLGVAVPGGLVLGRSIGLGGRLGLRLGGRVGLALRLGGRVGLALGLGRSGLTLRGSLGGDLLLLLLLGRLVAELLLARPGGIVGRRHRARLEGLFLLAGD